MISELTRYLGNITFKLRLNPSQERDILRELYTHLEERIQELEEKGLSEEEAIKVAVQSFGSEQVIAQQMNEIYGSGNWREAFWAATPHILFAFLFAARLWENAVWLIVIIGSILGVSAYGWWHNKPTWLFPWLGYSLLPVLLVGLFFLSLLGQSLVLLPGGLKASWWAWAVLLIYVPVSLRLLIPIVIQTVRRDWLLSSLTALPFPALLGWFLAVQHEGTILEYSKQRLSELSPSIALSFLALAAMVVLFIRVHRRLLKTGALIGAGLLVLVMLKHYVGESLPPTTLTFLTMMTLVLLISPAILERKVKHRRMVTQDWDYVLLQLPPKSK